VKIGVLLVLYQNLPFGDALKKAQEMGLEAVEIGVGGYPGNAHCNTAELLADEAKLADWKKTLDDSGLTVSALSVHGNPLHPQTAVADGFHQDWRNAVLMAEKLGVDTVITFSGCPGDQEGAKYPNWVTCAWPPDFQEILKWQWEEKLIPYWQTESAFAADHGVEKIALEMHPGFCVYNTETLLKLRQAVGENIGANFDPSHLYWQGMDPVACIKKIGQEGALFHFHAKDVHVDPQNAALNGTLDAKPYDDLAGRSWLFRTIGYGHGIQECKTIISALRTVGYDGAISIEHEDSLASVDEGFKKAVEVLQQAVFKEQPAEAWWV